MTLTTQAKTGMPPLEQIGAAVLDTHAWVWMSAGAPEARKAAAFRGRSIVSAISVWEVAMLVQQESGD